LGLYNYHQRKQRHFRSCFRCISTTSKA